ncbi:hypothetical protein A2721_02770 [Candidatus Gottesmanbacteria bacterium RIFCSPHIGHO2_01_FULL_47_48]|uniref:Uncharacterized protein n=1 Tax=Candidatus Gottesmanbacteria bacterium RIFCSPHIGHO2_01_FULL_47_48 TaxID=1798381 RepID=A0A1F6A466_9BACT|nr:MAG: hypothetical protein A2721_02770 [Candidatus Gottesmanbacteria bacterium RIFCSPHIGHO2_01_FULL_47_48]
MSDILENLTSQIPPASPLDNLTIKEKHQLDGKIHRLGSFLFSALFLLVPLTFAPVLSDYFDFPKSLIIFILVSLATLLLLAKNLLSGKLFLPVSLFTWPIALLTLIAIVSSFLSDNRVIALTADTLLLCAMSALFFTLSSHDLKNKSFTQNAVTFLLLSGSLLSLLTLAEFVYSLVSPVFDLTINSPFLSPTFNPTGSPLSATLFLLILLPLSLAAVQTAREEKKSPLTPVIFTSLLALGLCLNFYFLYQNRPILLDHETAWKIATNTLGNSPASAIFGVGPGHFVDAFTAGRPASFNPSPNWNLRFGTSSNLYFYLLTTLGIAGLASFVFLVVRFLRLVPARLESQNAPPLEKGLFAALAVTFTLALFLPTPSVSLFTLFVLLGLLARHLSASGVSLYAKEVEINNNIALLYGSTLAVLALILLSGYFLVRFLAADYLFAASLRAAGENRGSDTYNLQIQALTLNPFNSLYRLTYSQTNLALANSLAGQPNLSEEQKQTVVALVQQSLREGRLAAAQQPRRVANWENLSLIYRNLINFAQGADQWTIASLNQAITLEPTNPRLRLDLGGIYYAKGDFQTAAQAFAAAVNLKNDYANAHYNLAQALKQLKLDAQALQELQLTASLICSPATNSSADCQKVNKEITDLQSQPPATPSSPQATPSSQTAPVKNPQEPLASPAGQKSNLPKAKTTPPAQISSPSGEISL